MINQQLLDFIKGQLHQGLTKEKISSDLLGAGWTEQDVEEGFKAAIVPTPTLSYTPISPSYINTNTASPIQTKSHSNAKLFLTIFILFLLAGGGASAYYFRNNLVKLPILKDIFSSKNEIVNTEVPVNNINQVPNAPAPAGETTTPIAVNQSVTDGTLDCGSDLNCFIKAANNCEKVKFIFSVKNKEIPIFSVGTVDLTTNFLIEGKEKNNCVAKTKTTDAKLTYSKEVADSFFKEGKSQSDIEKMQNDYSKSMIGVSQKCQLDLSKKMGDALDKDLIKMTEISIKCDLLGCAYGTGLKCETLK